jgi:curved DNA-binding protein CbpA
MGERTHYEVLGIAVRASADEVRVAYRRAARAHHPDAGGDARAMTELNAAWHVLRDPERRAAYDRLLARRPAAGQPHAASTSVPERGEPDDGDLAREWADLADIVDTEPIRPVQSLEGWWAMFPPATLMAAIGSFLGAFVFMAPGLFALSGGLFVLALGLFVLAPLRAMSRKGP